MPSKSKKQYDFFKFVKNYQEQGDKAIKFLPKDFQDKIKKTANSIKTKDLDDFVNSIEGEDVFKINKPENYKVGYWVLVEPKIKNVKGENILPFIIRINNISFKNRTIGFKAGDYFHTNGNRREMSKYFDPNGNVKTLDFSSFDWIKKVSKSKEALVQDFNQKVLREEIRKIIKMILNQ